MLITSVMLATKFFDDETFNNLYYAKVGGLQVNEVNQLENKFLSLIGFSLTIRSDLFERYHCELVKHAKTNGNTKGSDPVSPLRSKLSHENLQSCPKSGTKNFHPLSRSTSSLVTKPTHTQTQMTPASKSTIKSAPQSPQPILRSTSQMPSQIRSICETLVADTVKNTTIQSQIMERLECESSSTSSKSSTLPKNSTSYQSGFDYTARDMIPTSDSNNTSSNSTSSNNTNTSSSGEGVNSGVNTGAAKGRANFSTCTPSYPSNHHIYGNRLLGVI